MSVGFRYQDRFIGKLEGKVFSKTVDKSIHFFRKTQSWAIDLATFESLPRDTTIVFYDKANTKTYTTDWKTYAKNGILERDMGHGRQIFLNIEFFH